MPMGIVSDSEFESALIDGSIPSTITIPPISHTIPHKSPLAPPINSINIPDSHIPDPATDNPESQHITHAGRSDGDLNVPNVLRKIIGEHSSIHGRAEALTIAEAFKVSPSSVSAYSVGATSTSTIDTPKEDLTKYIRDRKQKLSKKAMNRLGLALTHLDETKISNCDAPQLAHVASVMANVVKNLEPSKEVSDNNKNNMPNITFVTPIMKSEDAYTIIHTRE